MELKKTVALQKGQIAPSATEMARLTPEFLSKPEVKTQSWSSLPWAKALAQSFPTHCQPRAGRHRARAPGKLGLSPNSRALGADEQPGGSEKRMNIRIPEQNPLRWCSFGPGSGWEAAQWEDEVHGDKMCEKGRSSRGQQMCPGASSAAQSSLPWGLHPSFHLRLCWVLDFSLSS